MDAYCVICEGTIIVLNAIRSAISALPCGHVFHTTCINKRFDQSGSAQQSTCPQCSCNVVKSTATKLYLDLIPMEKYESDVTVINEVHESLRRKVQELQTKVTDDRVKVDKMSKVNNGLKKKILKLEKKLKMLEANDYILSYATAKLDKTTQDYDRVLAEFEILRAELVSRIVVNGNMKDVEERLSSLKKIDKRDLVDRICVYARDCRIQSEKRSKVFFNLLQYQDESKALRAKLVELENENSSLESDIEIYKQTNKTSLSNPGTSQAASQLLSPSTASTTSNTNVNFVSPVSSHISGTTQTPDVPTPDKYALVRSKNVKINSKPTFVIAESCIGFGRFNKPFKIVTNRCPPSNVKRPRQH